MLYGAASAGIAAGWQPRVYLLYSQAAQIVAHQELQLVLPSRAKEAKNCFGSGFNATGGQLRVLDGRTGLRPLLRAPTRRMQWSFAPVPWVRLLPLPPD